MKHGRTRFVIGFLAPPVALYVIFVIAPYAQAFQMSLNEWSGISPNPEFIGLENFERMFADEVFWKAVGHNLFLLVLLPVSTIAIALFFSFLINVGGRRRGISGIWGSRFYKVVFFFPQVLALVLLGAVFAQVFRPDEWGLLNDPLSALGVEPIDWLGNGDLALWMVLVVMIWQGVGFYVVLFSAGMASIPVEIYESAQLDGANRIQLFFRVTLPLLWDTVQVAWVYLGIIAIDAFAVVWVMTVGQGGPDNATTVLAVEVYRNMQQFDYGLASAWGVALFVLSVGFALASFRLSRREKVEF